MSANAPAASRPLSRCNACAPPAAAPSNSARAGRAAERSEHIAFAARARRCAYSSCLQLHGDADLDVGIACRPRKPPRAAKEGGGVEYAVAEIGFGDRTKSRRRRRVAARVARFGVVHVGRVDAAPALVDGGVIDQPAHGTRAGPGETVLDLLDLLGDVDVDRRLAGQRDDRRDFVARRRAQRMRRDADDARRQRRLRRILHQSREGLEVGDEPALLADAAARRRKWRARKKPAAASGRSLSLPRRRRCAPPARRGRPRARRPAHCAGSGIRRPRRSRPPASRHRA